MTVVGRTHVRKALPPRRDPFRIDVSAWRPMLALLAGSGACRLISEELCWTPLAIRAQARNHGVKRQ
jgi:hypothetical protein